MSSFLATAEPNTPQTPGSPASAAIVENDGWFPDIDMNALRASMRLDGTATHERLRDATIDAIASINAELGTWQAGQLAAGFGAGRIARFGFEPGNVLFHAGAFVELQRAA